MVLNIRSFYAWDWCFKMRLDNIICHCYVFEFCMEVI